MSLWIQLDRPYAHFTNLDFITGKVVLYLKYETAISAISVKLEGESRTRLAGPRAGYTELDDNRKRTEYEEHKVLYKVATLFPSAEAYSNRAATSGLSYSLAPGQYEYKFKFKLPFNNSCLSNPNSYSSLGIPGKFGDGGRENLRHLKCPLPPSLTGFPGEAEIKYYLKATVVRPQFYRENIRAFTDFKFLPIEPPRVLDRHEETFARRQQQFTKSGTSLRKNSLFKTSSQSDVKDDTVPPQFQIDARLPNPPVVTCNEPLPLRILIQRLDQSSEPVSLQVLQIELIGYTHVRAHDLARTESGTWLLVSKSNMNTPIPTQTNSASQEWKVPAQLWNNIPLPNTVAPSFDTCNISRTYELDVRVGLSHGAPEAAKPELIVVPLRLSLTVYSGVTPPQALLSAAAPVPQSLHLRHTQHNDPHDPSTPSESSSLGGHPSEHPSQIGSYDDPPPFPDDAPPSYEDALADDIAPFDGPRRDYNPPPSSPVVPDGKGSGVSRRVSERLFASNNIGQRPTWNEDAPPPMPPRPSAISEESAKKDQG